MLRKYTFWLKAFIIISLLTGGIHSLSFLNSPTPANELEEQLFNLMRTYKPNMGWGFDPSTLDLFTALSSCFALVYLLGGLTTWYLLRKNISAAVLKGITGIHLVIFGASFALMLIFTFPPPIILTGLAFSCLVLAYFLNREKPIVG